jgi:Cu-processing system permease protein
MLKVFKYSFYNLLRSLWLILYLLFFTIASSAMLFFADTFEKALVSMMSIMVGVVPLISILFGIMYYYSSGEFIELLLSQPVKRRDVFAGQLLAIVISLAGCFFAGVFFPFAFYGIFTTDAVASFLLMLLTGVILTIIFTTIAFFISISNENRIKGFGLGILVWLYFAIIYDGLFLTSLILLEDYPLEKLTIIFTLLNPIDIARVLILLKLEISSLMGYTGAVFKDFFGTSTGIAVSLVTFIIWITLPLYGFLKMVQKKDF